jgi:hypothetical protein
MIWEVWAIPTSNLIAAEESEAEALAVVRDLLSEGWKPSELVLILDDPALADEGLPPGVTGDELCRRAEAASPQPPRPMPA